MNPSFLHITNGDSTTEYLKSLKFQGDFITWREMLCEGRTSLDVGSESFWKTRFNFLKANYKVTKKNFINLTLKEYRNLCQTKGQKEIILWFEYDLFCQINLIALVSWIKRFRKDEKVTLICSGDIEGKDRKLGLCELNKEQIHQHFENRVELSVDDIEYADYVWQLYCSDSPLRLNTVKQFNPAHKFLYLDDALDLHLKRFPSVENGLNLVENYILKVAEESKAKSKHELVKNLLGIQNVFGFSDLQYFQKIDRMKGLFTSLNPVKLSRKGKKVITNELNFYQNLRNNEAYFGGAKKYSYLYYNATDKMLKITS